jgi:hypothetical protein
MKTTKEKGQAGGEGVLLLMSESEWMRERETRVSACVSEREGERERDPWFCSLADERGNCSLVEA